MALRTLHLCSGVGGLDLGLARWCRSVCHVEREGFAAACLVARMEEEALDRAWGGWVFDRERQTLRHDAVGCGPGCRTCGTYWATESPPVRVAHGSPDRVDRLRAIGNSVVPAQVDLAFRTLLEQIAH